MRTAARQFLNAVLTAIIAMTTLPAVAQKPAITEEEARAIGNTARTGPSASSASSSSRGYDVRGYFAWSLADNYEWHYSYEALFGLAHMDPNTYDRVFRPLCAEVLGDHTQPIQPFGP